MITVPETKIEYVMDFCGAGIFVKRDDLIPFSFGGNKVRIAREAFEDAAGKGCRTFISYGSASSNLNRVVSEMAAEYDVKCIIIVKKEDGTEENVSANENIVRASGAELVYTSPEKVRETVSGVLSGADRPYYIYGDETGKGNEEVLSAAYRKVFSEIKKQEGILGSDFPNIFTAVGTGSTVKGLSDGCDDEHFIHGISVARRAEAFDYLNEHAAVTDEYLFGGYGRYTEELSYFIREMYEKTGIPLDPCYTGKAFYGMLREIEKRRIKGNCLFIHTGGYPIFKDMMNI